MEVVDDYNETKVPIQVKVMSLTTQYEGSQMSQYGIRRDS